LEKFAKANASPARPNTTAPSTPVSTPPISHSYGHSPSVTPSAASVAAAASGANIQRSASQGTIALSHNNPHSHSLPSISGVMPPPILVNRSSSSTNPSPVLGPQSSPVSAGGGSGHHVHFSPSLPPLPTTPNTNPSSPFSAPLTLSMSMNPSPLMNVRSLLDGPDDITHHTSHATTTHHANNHTSGNSSSSTGTISINSNERTITTTTVTTPSSMYLQGNRLPPVPDSPHEPATPPSPEPGSPLTWLRGSGGSGNSSGNISASSSSGSLSGHYHHGSGTGMGITIGSGGMHRRISSAPESTPIGPAGIGNNGGATTTTRPPPLPEAPDSPMSPFPVRIPLKSPSGRPVTNPSGNDDDWN
jgi:hypothetical protein